MGARALVCLLSCICASSAVQVATAQSRPVHFADIGRISCAEGAERYLPGDYYFCAANKALREGDPRKARAMYEESARWGDKRAMFNLGLLLVRGGDLPREEALGLAWLALSAERRKDQLQREVLAGAWRAATPGVRDAADALWNTMKLEYADRFVLPRAQQRYERETRQLRAALQRDPLMRIQIAGIDRPMDGSRAMELLDRAAAETILRPLPGPQGEVQVGQPEVVRSAPPETPP